MDSFYYVPYNFNTRYAMPWYFRYVDPHDGRAEDPPPQTRRQIELYRRLLTTTDRASRDELMRAIIQVTVEQFYCMGIALRKREYGIAADQLRNTPRECVTAGCTPT